MLTGATICYFRRYHWIHTTTYRMLRNYFRVAIRNLAKNRFFSLINIGGLALGITASLLMLNYYRFETSYDQFHTQADRIYRVPMSVTEKGQAPQTFAFTFPAVANAMKSDFPEVEEAIRFRKGFGLIDLGTTKIPGLSGFWVDEEIFAIFDFPFLHGDAASALHEPNNVVLTKRTALKLFGPGDARGRTLTYANQEFQVSAVLEDIPINSHLQFDFLIPFKKYIELVKERGADADNSWGWSDFYTYVLLKPGIEAGDLESKLPDFTLRHKGESMKSDGYDMQFYLQPLTDIHMRSAYDYELKGNGNYAYLNYIAIASFFILFMAWLNYVNLSTSRSLTRAKEVGIRKSIGALRPELIKQFLTESTLVNGIAIVIGVGLMTLLTPSVSNLVGKTLSIPSVLEFQFWLPVVIFLVLGSVASGFYPAFVLSGFKPFAALKGLTGEPGAKTSLRKALVVVQVSLAVLLISGTVGLLKQIAFMRNRDLGIAIDQTLVLRDRVPRDSTQKPVIHSFVNELRRHASIRSVTASGDVPGGEVGGSSSYRRVENTNGKRCRNFEVDDQYFANYELPLLAGRAFSYDQGDDRHAVVINETAVKLLGFESPSEAIHQSITDGEEVFTIIGVVRDYHQESLQYTFDPIIFLFRDGSWDYYSLKMSGTDAGSIVAFTEATWKTFFPDSPFDYFFLDDHFNEQYKTEVTFGVLLSSFTVLGIIVACLGLIGLSSLSVARRTKEIGVRKVLGASIHQIVMLVTREYLWLVGLSFLMVIPLSRFMVAQWLDGYAFKVSLGLDFFVLPLILIVAVTLSTVGYQSMKAAWVNPVKSLKVE